MDRLDQTLLQANSEEGLSECTCHKIKHSKDRFLNLLLFLN